jgi:hypothetical protein
MRHQVRKFFKEFTDLRWKISTTNLTKTRVNPKAFTEKGLYMLAIILKSEKATQTTIAIVETFAKILFFPRSTNIPSLTGRGIVRMAFISTNILSLTGHKDIISTVIRMNH